jgi:hypothetical protein
MTTVLMARLLKRILAPLNHLRPTSHTSMDAVLKMMLSVRLGRKQVDVGTTSQFLIGKLARYTTDHLATTRLKLMRKKKKKQIVEILERAIIEAQEDLHFEEHQNARAYNSGLMDGVGLALKLLKPKSSVISLTSSWWEEPTQTLERTRERLIEFQYVDLEDPTPVGLFETVEAT